MRRGICCALALAVVLFVQPGAVIAQADTSVEITFWNSVKDSKNPAEISAYLDKYPNGTFAALARIRLDALKQKATQPPGEQWAAIGFAARGAWGAVWQKATRDEAEARALTPVCQQWRARLQGFIHDEMRRDVVLHHPHPPDPLLGRIHGRRSDARSSHRCCFSALPQGGPQPAGLQHPGFFLQRTAATGADYSECCPTLMPPGSHLLPRSASACAIRR